MEQVPFDLVIIGGGPGGYVAALRAAQLGMKTALIEGKHLGGVCLNWGCIPLKALLRSAEIYRMMKRSVEFGLTVSGADFRLDAIVKRSRSVVERLRGGIGHLLKKNGVAVFNGSGHLEGEKRVGVAREGKPTTVLSASHIVLATGARPRLPRGIEPDGKSIWTYKEALVPKSIPGSLLVIGAGAVGIELAWFYATFGADVTVVEMADRILPTEDEEISELTRGALGEQGLKFVVGTAVKSLTADAGRVTAILSSEDREISLTAERAIVAVGIVGNTGNLGIEKTRIRVENSHIVVDQWLRTDEPGVYAIGDVAGPPRLAHKASHEGVICVERIAGVESARPMDTIRIPNCVYCHPQVASVGLTEKTARDRGYRVSVGRFPFSANGKAVALGEAEGIVKTVFDANNGAILGAHMVGGDVSELIHGFAVAMTLEATETEMIETIFPHPTLSEMMHESVMDGFGKALHK